MGANFIIKNTQGATLGQSSATTGADPWGTESRYRPGEVPQSTYQSKATSTPQPLPQKQYLSIVLGKPATAFEQVSKKNADYGETDMALTKSDLHTLSVFAQQLAKYDFSRSPSLPYSNELVSVLPSLVKAATQWQPPNNRLAPLDLLRFLAAALQTLPPQDVNTVDPVAAVLGSNIFDEGSIDANAKLVMMSVRFFSNLLYGSGKKVIDAHLDSIIESLKP